MGAACCSNQTPDNQNLEVGQSAPPVTYHTNKEYDQPHSAIKQKNYNKGNDNDEEDVNSKSHNVHAPSENVAKPIDELPDYSNANTNITKQKMGNFSYDEQYEEGQYPELGPYQFDNGAIYLGQWKHGNRHGKGVQYWTDGSIYEGYYIIIIVF